MQTISYAIAMLSMLRSGESHTMCTPCFAFGPIRLDMFPSSSAPRFRSIFLHIHLFHRLYFILYNSIYRRAGDGRDERAHKCRRRHSSHVQLICFYKFWLCVRALPSAAPFFAHPGLCALFFITTRDTVDMASIKYPRLHSLCLFESGLYIFFGYRSIGIEHLFNVRRCNWIRCDSPPRKSGDRIESR